MKKSVFLCSKVLQKLFVALFMLLLLVEGVEAKPVEPGYTNYPVTLTHVAENKDAMYTVDTWRGRVGVDGLALGTPIPAGAYARIRVDGTYLSSFTVPAATIVTGHNLVKNPGGAPYWEMTVHLGQLDSATAATFLYNLKLKDRVVPDGYVLTPQVDLFVPIPGEEPLHIATSEDDPALQAQMIVKTDNPLLNKHIVTNQSSTRTQYAEDGRIVYGGTPNADQTAIADPTDVKFQYTLSTTQGYQQVTIGSEKIYQSWGNGKNRTRAQASIDITDTLPTYTKSDGTTATAVFDAAKNPGWTDRGDGTVSYTVTESAPARGDADVQLQNTVSLYLQFPDAALARENPDEVVAELHCRADFQDKATRYLTSLWRAPIIVTTAVAFFETLASNRPSALRRLHELPGSVIFLDEAHNALPLKLLPLAWRWMNTLAEEWNCYWVLASGSLVRYWELDSLEPVKMPNPDVDELVNKNLREQLMRYEQHRVSFRCKPEAINRKELMDWVQNMPGPRLLIVNTVQSAAVIADDFCNTYGRGCVEHLSTALTAEDRGSTIEQVKARLKNEGDTDWTLVATSCVEAGVDFSFRSGFRELSSLLSLLQASGRVNRSGLFPDAIMWSFTLQEDSMLKKNPRLDTSREVLKSYFIKSEEISPEHSTKSMNDELIRDDSCIKTIKHLNKLEDSMQFNTVCDEFAVIESNTVAVVVDDELAKSIEYGRGDWQLLQ